MILREIESPVDLERAFAIIRELRPRLSLEDFLEIRHAARSRDEYRLIGIFEDECCLSIMGFRILFDFVHGRHLYVDDLVTTATQRSRGLGRRLLEFAEDEANRLDCETIRLCTGIENADGIRFYRKNGWENRALVFKKKLR